MPVRLLLILTLFLACAFKVALPPPPDMWANTGAPGEGTCVACHNLYPINSGGGYIKLSADPPFTNGHYVPGQQYAVTATFTQAPEKTYQCSVEIIDSLGQNAGTIALIDSISNYLETASSGRHCVWAGQYEVDTVFRCTFNWTAPQSGEVNMYTAGVVHGAQIGGSTGHVYNDSLVHLRPGVANNIADHTSNGLSLFPTPASDYLHIKGGPDILSYKIVDITGKVMAEGTMHNGTLNVSSLPAGNFYLQLNINHSEHSCLQFVKR